MKTGDRVICIEGAGHRLEPGKEYTVLYVGKTYLRLEGVIGGWYRKRFAIKSESKWNGVRKPYIPKAYKTYLGLGGTRTYKEFAEHIRNWARFDPATALKAQEKKRQWVKGTYRMIRIGEE